MFCYIQKCKIKLFASEYLEIKLKNFNAKIGTCLRNTKEFTGDDNLKLKCEFYNNFFTMPYNTH